MQLQDLATHNSYARLLLPKISNLLIEENFKLLARIVSRKSYLQREYQNKLSWCKWDGQCHRRQAEDRGQIIKHPMPPKKLEHVAEKTNKASSKTTTFQPEIWYIDLPYFCEAPVLSVTRTKKSKGCVYKDFFIMQM